MTRSFVLPGEVRAGAGSAVLTTILGSGVAVCLAACDRRVGGMAHFVLPDGPTARYGGGALGWGRPAIEALATAMLEHGVRLSVLDAKVFGGAQIAQAGVPTGLPVGSPVGERNVRTAIEELEWLGIPVSTRDTGGSFGRKVVFEIHTGRAMVSEVRRAAS